MGSHEHHPVEIDPQALKDSRQLWEVFTKMTTVGVVAIVVVLALMALFLV